MHYPRTTDEMRRSPAMLASLVSLALLGMGSLAPGLAHAAAPPGDDPAAQGLWVAEEADRRDSGWEDSRVDLTMILRNRHGDESVRQLRNRSLEGVDDGDKSIIIFDEPKDVAGTALLTHSHATEPDDQWLYLPALKRVKRIASSNKSGPFMGSEFAYEDLSSQEVEKYSYRYLREEELDGQATYVVERYPEDEDSGYTRQVAWIDHEHFRVLKVDYYDRKDDLLKTLTTEGWEQYLDQYWRPGVMHMVNHQTGKSTELRFEDYSFGNGFDAGDFDRNALRKAR